MCDFNILKEKLGKLISVSKNNSQKILMYGVVYLTKANITTMPRMAQTSTNTTSNKPLIPLLIIVNII